MKFTAGYWDLRPGVEAAYAAEAYEVKVEPDTLTVYAPARPITSRGATLNLPLITLEFSSPMPNVIRARAYHFKGGRPTKPEFVIFPQAEHEVSISDGERACSLTSGQLSVRVEKAGNWRVDFLGKDGVITGSGWKGLGYMITPEGNFMREQLDLAVGECVYGLGERFTPFVKNGQVVDMWNEDGGTSSEIAYKNVPFYMTNRGYGVFVNHPGDVSFEVASENVERVQFSVPGEVLEYFVIYGPTPKEVLERYTALTGRPALPPAWSFGLWLTTSFTTSYDEDTVNSFVQGMADRDIPLRVFHFDCFWMREFHWVNLLWDERVFPDPKAMLQRLKDRGLKICVWINPYVAQQSIMFDEGMKGGYLLKKPNGDIWQWDRWQAGMGVVDFTNPEARAWYAGKLSELVDMGVDCFKTDFGERIPVDVAYYDGSDPVRMHNYYSYLYNKTVFEMLEEKLGKGQAAVFARSGTAGSQQFPVHWGGDSTATYPSMAETLRGGLSLSQSGFGFWSHDISGFENTATSDLYKRWCAFGLLSSHSRLHGAHSYRVPWLFDEEAVDVLRFFTKLKCRLMPYLFEASVQAHERGIPVMRAMVLEFPGDPGCDYLDRQYMLGDSLLVAPIFSPDGTVAYYLPQGRWTNFFTGEAIDGGRWLQEHHDYMSLPLMVREGAVIPVGSNEERPDYDYADGVTYHVFGLEDGMTRRVRVPDTNGEIATTATVSREGDSIRVTTEGGNGQWRVLLRGVSELAGIEGGTSQSDTLGVLLQPEQGARSLTARVKAAG